MPRLLHSRDIIERLLADGFEHVSTPGSHRKFVHPRSRRMVIVPHRSETFPSER